MSKKKQDKTIRKAVENGIYAALGNALRVIEDVLSSQDDAHAGAGPDSRCTGNACTDGPCAHKAAIGIKRIVFSGPATVIIWSDDTKTKAMLQAGDTYSKETGVMVCTLKKLLGKKGFRTLMALIGNEEVSKVQHAAQSSEKVPQDAGAGKKTGTEKKPD